MSAHVRRIETVEKELKALAERTAEKSDVTKLRAEMKQIYDGLHIGEFRLSNVRHVLTTIVRILGPPCTCMGTP